MKRRDFTKILSAGSGLTLGMGFPWKAYNKQISEIDFQTESLSADLVIIGGGLGGCASALAACRNGLTVILTEETDWIGGQVSQQGVPPDEHPWIETHGAPRSYRDYRNRVREFYRKNYPLTDEARQREFLNPGDGSVSRICHEPRVAVAVLMEMLMPYLSSGKLALLLEHSPVGADVDGDEVRAIEVEDQRSGKRKILEAPFIVDATELGELLPLTGTEYVTGTESRNETGELHAPEKGDPKNHQAFTLCFAMDYQPGRDNVIDRPENYDFWYNYVPKMDPPWAGKL